MPCQGYLFSMSTIHFATFSVTGFCRICQFSLFSQVSAVGVHLDNFVANAMPGLLVFHVHHTFCNFHSDWILQDLPTFFFSFVSTSNLRTLMSISFHPKLWAELCRIWNFLWRGKSGFVEPGFPNLFSFAPNHTVYLKLENLDVYQFSSQTLGRIMQDLKFSLEGSVKICRTWFFKSLLFCTKSYCLPQTWEPWCLSVFILKIGQNYAGSDIFFGGVSQDL